MDLSLDKESVGSRDPEWEELHQSCNTKKYFVPGLKNEQNLEAKLDTHKTVWW